MATRITGFDKLFRQQMKRPGFARQYAEARRDIDAVDGLIRCLDEARIQTGISKAELARRISAKPEIVRRLFTAEGANPTLSTVLRLVVALGYRLELVRAGPSARRRTKSANGRRRAAA